VTRHDLRRRGRAATVLLLAGLSLTGCSQIAAVAPVGGTRLAEVRFGTLDALVEADIDLLTAPVCTEGEAGTITCTGTAVDGRDITSVSRRTAPDQVEVVVDGDTVYSGSLTDLLDRAAGEAG
jgi:hypothetical protein